MGIPIYNQQVAPPQKPRMPNVAAAKARAAGQLAGQVEQIGTAFAGKLFDLANKNQINEATVKAREKWRGFWGELQRDPDYATYGEKLDNFYASVREEVGRGMKLPRARREIETQFQNLRQDWGDAVQRLSDERAIDHARTVRIQGVNQAVWDLDTDRVLAQLQESEAAREFSEPDHAKIKDAALREVVASKTMEYARMQGDAGMQWLMSEDAQTKFQVDLSPEERYFLDTDTRNQMAVQLSQERTNKKNADEIADFQRKKRVIDFARAEISSGRLTSVDQLYQPEYMDRDPTLPPHLIPNLPVDLKDEDRVAIGTMLADRAEALEKDREAYSDDMLQVVKDALEAKDLPTAAAYLAELAAGGYQYDAMGRRDPELRRYIEQYDRLAAGGIITDFDKAANTLWARLRDGQLAGMRKELDSFLENYPTKEGREEHQQLLNELQELEREGERRATSEIDESVQAGYYTYFWHIVGADNVKLDELVKVKRWLYANFPRNEHDKKLPGIRESIFVQWLNLIDTKEKQLQRGAADLRATEIKMGEDRINSYWKPHTQRWEGATSQRAVKEMAKVQDKRAAMLLGYLRSVQDEKVSPLAKAQELINAEAKIEVENQFGSQYKKPAAGEISLKPTGGDVLREYALRSPGAGAPPTAGGAPRGAQAQPVPGVEMMTFRGETYVRASSQRQLEEAKARIGLAEFAKYAQNEQGLIIKRDRITSELSLFNSQTKKWVKTDEGVLLRYAEAWTRVEFTK